MKGNAVIFVFFEHGGWTLGLQLQDSPELVRRHERTFEGRIDALDFARDLARDASSTVNTLLVEANPFEPIPLAIRKMLLSVGVLE